jgi:hypothetical protein
MSGETKKRPNTGLILAPIEESTPKNANVVGLHLPTSIERQDSRVVLIRPADDSSKRMLTSPEQLCSVLEARPFSTMRVEDVRVNPRKGLIAVQLMDGSEEDVAVLLQMTQLGPWSVKCSQPNQGKYCYGVISPVDIEADIMYHINAMERRVKVNGPSKFVKMERLNRNFEGKRVPATSIWVVFEGRELPNKMKIGYIAYSVRPYSFPPLQCYCCQRYGHSADGCTSKRRCLVCAGEHHYKECTSKQPKCANCGGPHKANFPECDRAPGPGHAQQARSNIMTNNANNVSTNFIRGSRRSDLMHGPSQGGMSSHVPDWNIRQILLKTAGENCLFTGKFEKSWVTFSSSQCFLKIAGEN